MKKASFLVSTSRKEGWGFIVIEANSQVIPAIIYDVYGLRNSANFKGNQIYTQNPDQGSNQNQKAQSEENHPPVQSPNQKYDQNNDQKIDLDTLYMRSEMTNKMIQAYHEFNKNQIKYQQKSTQMLNSSKKITFE